LAFKATVRVASSSSIAYETFDNPKIEIAEIKEIKDVFKKFFIKKKFDLLINLYHDLLL
jgi:hypothetical protein